MKVSNVEDIVRLVKELDSLGLKDRVNININISVEDDIDVVLDDYVGDKSEVWDTGDI